MQDRRRLAATLVVAVSVTIIATFVRLAITPLLGTASPFSLYLVAVVVAAWYGGLWPGLLSTFLGYFLGDFLFVEPRHTLTSLGAGDLVRLISFVIVGASISFVSEQWHRALARDRTRARDLEREIAERKNAVEELLLSTRSLEMLVAAAPIPMIVIEPDSRVLLWNKAAERVFGWDSEEVLGKPIPIVPTDKYEESQRTRDAVALGITVGPIPTTRLRRDGTLVDVELSAAPLRGQLGRVDSMVLLLNDITERLFAEKALARSEELLREANRRKDEFLATLAHELRNPLSPIQNSLTVMRLNAYDSSAVEKTCGLIERQLAHLVRLTDDLLDVSRISRGKIELRLEWIDLKDAVQAAVETSRPAIEAHGHRLILRLPDEPIPLRGDLTRLAQLFANLFQNAAKYTEKDGRIELEAHRDGTEAVVRVRDNGIGIHPNLLARIFEPFMQADRTPERAQGGLGIGLTLVKRIAELHGGSVAGKSEGTGRGSEFEVRLPVAERPPAARKPADDGDGILQAAGPRRRLLVVDDSEDSVSSLAMLLDLMGHETETAGDGEEALERAETFRPEVVLLDIGMPRMSGYEACRRLRERPWARSIVVIALTGWGQAEDRERSLDAGFDHHLVKPVDPEALARLLAELPLAPLPLAPRPLPSEELPQL